MARSERKTPLKKRMLSSAAWPWLTAIVAVTTFFFRDILFGGRTFLFRDHLMLYLPREASFRAAIAEGGIPLWDPLFLGGQPFAANTGRMVFYPPHLLVLLGDLATGYGLFIFFHVVVAALGMFALLRFADVRNSAATLGALAFALGGPFISNVHLLPMLCTISWMPWIARFTEGFLQTRRPIEFLGATICLGLLALGGDPVQALLVGVLMVGWSVARQYVRVGSMTKSGLLRDGVSVITIGGCALVLASVQILPAFDFARDTIRTEPMSFEMASYWSFPPGRVLEFLFPQVIQRIDPGYLYPESGGQALLVSVYLGLVVCVLTLAGLASRSRGAGFLAGTILVSGIFAFGSHTPLFRLIHDAGLLSSLRYPEKVIPAIALLVVFWSAMTFERLRGGDDRLRRWTIGIAIGVTVFALVFFAARGADVAAEQANNAYWLKMAVIGAITVVLLVVVSRSESEVPAILLIAFMVFADLGGEVRRSTPTMPGELLEAPAAAATLDEDRDQYRIFNHAALQFLDDRTPESMAWFRAISILLHRNATFPLSNGIWGFSSVLEWDTEHTALLPYVQFQRAMYEVRDSGQPNWMRMFGSMANVRYRVEFRSFARAGLRADMDARAIRPVDFIRTESGPRYYFATSIRRAKTPQDFVADLSENRWSPGATWVDLEPFEPARGEVLRVEESRHSISLSVHAEGRSYLNISITPHRYWSATIDGEPAELHVSNVGFQGLEVPAGEHRIEMRYRNPVVMPAIAVSCAAFILLVAGTIVLERRTRHDVAEDE